MKKAIKLTACALFICASLTAGNILEIGTGWENMGISPETTWRPYHPTHCQGSRKEVNAFISYGYITTNRVYWAPLFRLQYGATWSLQGAMNTMELQASPFGIGFYLSQPPSAYDSPKGHWFCTAELGFSAHLGLNMTKNRGVRSEGEKEWTDVDNQYGNQYYPFGNDYYYWQLATPVRLRVWRMFTEKFGFGMHLTSDIMVFEKSFNYKEMPWAIGYNMQAGFSFMFF